MSGFSVTRLSEGMVKPCKPTPCNITLPLSPLDKLPPLKLILLETLFMFKHGIEPAKIIREALSKVLVPYYPVAGEISVSEQGEMEVACTARGVWFVEASANYTLEDFDYFDNPSTIPKHDLFPPPPPGVEDPTDLFVMLQVTKFKCDGFVVGLRSNHVMFDGVGMGEFLKAIGEVARGNKEPSLHPLWCRDEVPMKPHITLTFPPPSSLTTLASKRIDVSLQQINQLKNIFNKQTDGKRCTTFEVLVAKLWRSRVRAMKADPDVVVKVAFVVNGREYFVNSVLQKEGFYYGNCMYMKEVEAPSWKIVNGSFSEVVELIQDAKRGLSAEFSEWVAGECRTKEMFMNYEMLVVNDWTKLGLADMDFGWGAPLGVIPVQNAPVSPTCLFTTSPKLEQGGGVCLRTGCVKEEHLEEFLNQMNNLDSDDAC